ncbi:MAG: YgiQ family radical SAM protein [Candidatus Omnitrophica bacterium]|nr:YgiQ family radical SAM protein [Candidatus Omnitrophota bacterium]
MNEFPFLPMFPDEAKKKGWDEIDVLIVSGELYVDHPSYGVAVIGRILESRGYKVGIIAQPDWNNLEDFKRFGRPRLCACVTAGNVDSMIANYTANKRPRRQDENAKGYKDKRPDRATIVYANRLRAVFKNIPVIIGGIEASMRRLTHYDYWDNAVRRSLLIDAKADLLIYGMGERQIIEVVDRLNKGETIHSIRDVRGTVVKVKKDELPADAILAPSFEEIAQSPEAFNKAFHLEYDNMNPYTARTIVQPHANQYVVQLPPAWPLSTDELDATYALPYVRAWHPFYDSFGGVNGFETVRWSIIAVRGCPGECSFCGLSMHQGRMIQSRSHDSILKEAKALAQCPDFKGTITDIGGPTANLYGAHCRKQEISGPCADKQCLMPEQCSSLEIPYAKTLALYEAIRKIPNVKHVFVSSGLRYDLLLEPGAEKYFKELCAHYISGQMKVAPEHTDDEVLAMMNKPSYKRYEEFVKKFERINADLEQRVYLVNYFIKMPCPAR